jgi:Tfp pilus assembly protein PilV
MLGKIKEEDGVTTFEVMVSLFIISLIVIYSFTALHTFQQFSSWNRHTLQANTLMYSKLNSSKSSMLSNGVLTMGNQGTGAIDIDGLAYSYNVSSATSSLSSGIVTIKCIVQWTDSRPHSVESQEYVTLRSP